MLRFAAALALLILPAQALGAGQYTSEALGWTKDGRFFAFRRTDVELGKSGERTCEATNGVVFDSYLLEQRAYLFTPADEKLLCRHPFKIEQAEFQAWQKSHPLVLEEGPRSPRGFSIAASGKGLTATWKGPQLELACAAPPCRIALAVEGAAGERTSVEAELPSMAAMQARVFWSPDDKRAIALISSAPHWVSTAVVLLAPVHSPRVQLVGDDLLVVTTAPSVLEKLGQAGVVVASVGPAKALRSKTEIFARHGDAAAQREGERIAQALTTQAAVQPLSWDAPAEVVVALGTPASPDAARFQPLPDDFPKGFSKLEELRWSADSRFVLLKSSQQGCCGSPIETCTRADVVDTATHEVACFQVEAKAFSRLVEDAAERADIVRQVGEAFSGCSSRAALEAFASAREWKPGTPGKGGPGRPELQVQPSAGEGAWKGEVYHWKPPAVGARADSADWLRNMTLKLAVGKAGAAVLPKAGEVCSTNVQEPVACDSSFVWAPDGSRVAWLLVSDLVYAMAGYHAARVVVASSRAPRIKLIAHDSIGAKVVRPARIALSDKGFLVNDTAKAESDRPKSVVFFASGQEEAARAVAEAVPGKASVEPLTWKETAELVVALGRSALPAQ